MNYFVYLILAILFVFISFCLKNNYSAFNMESFLFFVQTNKAILILEGALLLFSYKSQRYSNISLLCFFAVVLLDQVRFIDLSLPSSSKLIFLMTFFFILLNFFFYLMAFNESKDPAYNPNYLSRQIWKTGVTDLKVSMFRQGEREALYEGILTNWGEHSAFVHLDNPYKLGSDTKVDFTFEYAGCKFNSPGKIVTYSEDLSGIGILFLAEKDSHDFQWQDLCGILYDKGIVPGIVI